MFAVVPRKGDVDRNEIERNPVQEDDSRVVPRKGDVDRNPLFGFVRDAVAGRPPQGGRG